MANTNLKPIAVKVEVSLTDRNTHKIVVTPRDSDADTNETLDALFHAILSQQPKRGAYLLGSSSFSLEVKLEDVIDSLET